MFPIGGNSPLPRNPGRRGGPIKFDALWPDMRENIQDMYLATDAYGRVEEPDAIPGSSPPPHSHAA